MCLWLVRFGIIRFYLSFLFFLLYYSNLWLLLCIYLSFLLALYNRIGAIFLPLIVINCAILVLVRNIYAVQGDTTIFGLPLIIGSILFLAYCGHLIREIYISATHHLISLFSDLCIGFFFFVMLTCDEAPKRSDIQNTGQRKVRKRRNKGSQGEYGFL